MPYPDALWLVELTGYTDASTSAVYRFANGKYITRRTDTPAETLYDDCLIDPGTIERSLFGGVSGLADNPRSQTGAGSIALGNLDGHLDSIFDGAVSFRERPVRVLRVARDAAYSTAQVVLVGVISQIELKPDQVVVNVKDRSGELDSPHLTTTYAGNNALPNGLEGVTDLAGKVKPRAYGTVSLVEPPMVNTARLIVQLNNGAIVSATLYEGGSTVAAGADYTSQSDMETNPPAANQVRVWPAGGMARLGFSPTYPITATIVADSAPNSTAAQLIKRLALERGISSGDISASDVTALDAANSATLGLWVDDSTTTADLIDQVARSVGGYWGFDSRGVLRMGRFDAPSGSAVAEATPSKSGKLERVANDEDIPATVVRIRYAQYRRTQSASELAGPVTDAQASDLAQEWRVAESTTTLSPNPHKRTRTIERDTLFASRSDALTEAARLLALAAVVRRTHLLTDTVLDSGELGAIDLAAVCTLRWPRYGFDAGSLRRVLSMRYALARNALDITLWGS